MFIVLFFSYLKLFYCEDSSVWNNYVKELGKCLYLLINFPNCFPIKAASISTGRGWTLPVFSFVGIYWLWVSVDERMLCLTCGFKFFYFCFICCISIKVNILFHKITKCAFRNWSWATWKSICFFFIFLTLDTVNFLKEVFFLLLVFTFYKSIIARGIDFLDRRQRLYFIFYNSSNGLINTLHKMVMT